MKKILIASILLLSLHSLAQETTTATNVDFNALDNYIQEAVTDFELPGLAVAIVKDGDVVFSKGYGKRKLSEDVPVDENSLFGIASLSKAFTVACIGMLVEEGKLSWNDKVIQHLPEFELSDPYVTQHMTIRDLLSHRSGLRTFDGDLLWYGSNYSRQEIMERIRNRPISKEFRAEFGYQNIMYITAGQLIERVSGMSWDKFMKTRIFDPLGMESSNTSIKNYGATSNVAYPHLKGKVEPLLNYDNSGATAATNSSISDLSKWIKLWLNNGIYNGDTLFTEKTTRMAWSPHTNLSVGAFDQQNGTHFKSYGLGWFLIDYQGRKVIHHGGGLPGYISKLALVPEENLGLIVLTNGNTSLPTALMYKIIDLYTNPEGDRDWVKEFLEYKEKGKERAAEAEKKRLDERKTGTNPSLPLSAYAGTYEDKMYGEAAVEWSRKKLMIRLLPSEKLFSGTLEHWHDDTFKVVFNDNFLPFALITFEKDGQGNIVGFKIDLPNPDFHFFLLDFKKL